MPRWSAMRRNISPRRSGSRDPTSLLPDEDAVLVGCAEVDADLPDMIAEEGEKLGVAKYLPLVGGDFVENKGLPVCFGDTLDIDAFHALAVRPAPLKIGGLVDAIVVGAGKPEVVCQQLLDDLAVLGHVGGEEAADDLRLALRTHMGLPDSGVWHSARGSGYRLPLSASEQRAWHPA